MSSRDDSGSKFRLVFTSRSVEVGPLQYSETHQDVVEGVRGSNITLSVLTWKQREKDFGNKVDPCHRVRILRS